jgi:signal transduction histidine kinase
VALTLRTKLVGGFATIVVTTLAASAVGYWQADRLASALYEVGVVRLPSLSALEEVDEAMSAIQAAERTLLLPGLDVDIRTQQRQDLKRSVAQLDRGIASYEPLPQTRQESEAWRVFTPALGAWRSEHLAVIALVDQAFQGSDSPLTDARARSLGAANAAFHAARVRLGTVIEINHSIAAEVGARSVDGQQRRVAIGRFMLLFAGLAVLTAVLLGVVFGRRFSAPLVDMSAALSRIARGDLAGALQSSQRAQQQSTSELMALNERYEKQRSALAALMRRSVEQPESLVSALQAITEVVADAIDGERISIYRFAEHRSILVCDDLFERATSRHSSGLIITREEWPEVFTDPDNATIVEVAKPPGEGNNEGSFLAFLHKVGVTTYMRAQIRAHGVQVGALVCAHVGDREWHSDEQAFMAAAANFIAALIAQTEGRKLEAQLRQAQKMEAFGQLASGVAHDFNNILTVIIGQAYQLAHDDRIPPDLQEGARDILLSGERAGDLTRQLLSISRRQAMKLSDVDLNTIVTDMVRMLGRILGEAVCAETLLAAGPIRVHVDRGMIDQVLMNLAVNARDAMPGGGCISIETALEDVEPHRSGLEQTTRRGSFARLRVRDTGSGIAPDHLTQIFEPFFTTKAPGKGTGLGLATTFSIVQQHGGWIDVMSAVGAGTTFTIFLPLADTAAATAP